MIVNGQMRKFDFEKYNEQPEHLPEPIMASI